MISVLLNIQPDDGHEARLQAAIALVRSQGGHISCVQTISAMPAPADLSAAGSEVEYLAVVDREASDFQEAVEAGLAAADVGWSWERFYGDPATILVERSRIADLIILSPDGSFPPISSVALSSEAPILAVPSPDPHFTPDQSALVAWNGSRPAAHATRGALPLLQFMEPVHILSVDGDSNAFPASLAQEYLSHHRIKSDIHWRSSDEHKVADAIINIAEELGSGLIVAGAFGHNRLREMLLGSVTRALLKNSPLPLLLAH
jgi:nucleotide-binding universal stress UspA family protein